MLIIISRVKILGNYILRKRLGIMKRSRAFVLTELLMTVMLHTMFILIMCSSFYVLISFYTRTQQVLTARNHAERVISFMDEKMRNAGLGLWRCKDSATIRKMNGIFMLREGVTPPIKGYRLPVALQWYKDNIYGSSSGVPEKSKAQDSGDVVTVLYAKRNLSSGNTWEVISAFANSVTLAYQKLPDGAWDYSSLTNNMTANPLKLLDSINWGKLRNDHMFEFNSGEQNIKQYAVMESVGVPLYLSAITATGLTVKAMNAPSYMSRDITVPAGGDLMGLGCMQMFVHDNSDGEGRQFAFRELKDDGNDWGTAYNQEKGILDIYMRLNTDKNMFTLYVLATGGYDESASNPRPSSWPKEANPAGNTDDEAQEAWGKSDYCHHIIYVSRASWRLNNIPQGFIWN